MNFPLIVIDESVDGRISAALQTEGYDVHFVAQNLPGIDDTKIIELAVAKHAFIIN